MRITKDIKSVFFLLAILVGAVMTLAYFIVPRQYFMDYYAGYKEARKSIQAVPGVEIIDEWKHEDIILEDCGFTVRVNGSENVRVDFLDGEKWQNRFTHLDGVVMTSLYSTNGKVWDMSYLDANTLRTIGVNLGSLGDVLQNIDPVLSLARSRPRTTNVKKVRGEWCYILYDLERDKEGQQSAP